MNETTLPTLHLEIPLDYRDPSVPEIILDNRRRGASTISLVGLGTLDRRTLGKELLAYADTLLECAGEMHAEYLIQHPNLIPTGWHGYIIFPGTRRKWGKNILYPYMCLGRRGQWEIENGSLETLWLNCAEVHIACLETVK